MVVSAGVGTAPSATYCSNALANSSSAFSTSSASPVNSPNSWPTFTPRLLIQVVMASMSSAFSTLRRTTCATSCSTVEASAPSNRVMSARPSFNHSVAPFTSPVGLTCFRMLGSVGEKVPTFAVALLICVGSKTM